MYNPENKLSPDDQAPSGCYLYYSFESRAVKLPVFPFDVSNILFYLNFLQTTRKYKSCRKSEDMFILG